ncbi:MAG: hypothetical protein M1820_002116 [Bogoriella megaspora]|nr:MAG: hypothetical protein M1820_002116 [Bogoriella megaspora]
MLLNIARPSSIPSYSTKGPSRAPTVASHASFEDLESMKSKILQLEEQLYKANEKITWSAFPGAETEIQTTSSRIPGSFHATQESHALGLNQGITRNIMHKTRLFGQSHWFNGAAMFRDVFKLIQPYLRQETSKAAAAMQQVKLLAKRIKAQRAPPWPLMPNSDLPPKDVVDKLVESYLRTVESLYRILHIPTFQKAYAALWVAEAEPDTAFLIQLKLVLAIGSVTYDDQFSLRTSAIRWVYEAQAWLSEPVFKPRLNVQTLQINILMLLARELIAVGDDLVWIPLGALLRTAIFMGLHRDPSRLPKVSKFVAEMRRRLWNTILEMTLQSSITSGTPPMIGLDDFDTEPPGNFDDDQLLVEDSLPKPDNHFTQSTVAIALRRTFPFRLAITKFLNDLETHHSYEQTLQLDGELRASSKVLRQTLQRWSSSNGPAPSPFQIQALDVLMLRYLSALHIPFFGAGLHKASYAFSRKVVFESSLKIWYATWPSSFAVPTLSQTQTESSSETNDFAQFTTGGSAMFGTIAMSACFVIAAEIMAQLQDEESVGQAPLRQDLLRVIDDAKSWTLRRLEAGETNTKGYLLMSLIKAQIDGLRRGLKNNEMPSILIQVAEEVGDTCLRLLEGKAAEGQTEGDVDELKHMSLDTSPGLLGDWDFIMPDAFFGSGDMDPITWNFNDEFAQGFSF